MERDGYASSTELIDLHDQGMIRNADIECLTLQWRSNYALRTQTATTDLPT